MGSQRVGSRMPPQLEKNHVVPTAWQDEALARDGVSREVPCSALKGETVRRHSRVTTGISAFPLGWPWEAQSSPRVARESWGLRSSHCRAASWQQERRLCPSGSCQTRPSRPRAGSTCDPSSASTRPCACAARTTAPGRTGRYRCCLRPGGPTSPAPPATSLAGPTFLKGLLCASAPPGAEKAEETRPCPQRSSVLTWEARKEGLPT